MLSFVPMNTTATLVTSGGLDAWGEPMANQSQTLSCHIRQNQRRQISKEGETFYTDATILFEGEVNVDEESVIFINEIKHDPSRIHFMRDLAGNIMLTKVEVRF